MEKTPEYVTRFLSAVERLSGHNISLPGIIHSIIMTTQIMSRPVLNWTAKELEEKNERAAYEKALDFLAHIEVIRTKQAGEMDSLRLLFFVFCMVMGIIVGIIATLACSGFGG